MDRPDRRELRHPTLALEVLRAEPGSSLPLHIIRDEKEGKYKARYRDKFAKIREATRTHRNAQFDMLERALMGCHTAYDAETIDSLEPLLCRGFRDYPVDLNGQYETYGTDEACGPIPVGKRPYEDCLWQRAPFTLKGGNDGSLESPGIDFILPYWMARYHRVIP